MDKMFDAAFEALHNHLATPCDGAAWIATRDTLAAIVRSHVDRINRAEATKRRSPEATVRARFRARTAAGIRP